MYFQLFNYEYIVVADVVFNQELLSLAINELFLMGVKDVKRVIRN